MSTDFEKLNIVLAARDREFARAMEANTRRIERFTRDSQKGLSKTAKGFDALGAAAKALGPVLAAVSVGAVVAKVRETVAALDQIGKTADRIGITTDALQELRTVAESAGVETSNLDASLEKFGKALGESAMGMGEAKLAFARLGLEAKQLQRLGIDGALSAVADAMASIQDPTERTALAMKIFGESGAGMLNLLREGSAGMAQMREDARALGIVIDEKLIRQAEDAQTQLDLMSRVISANLSTALINLAPVLVSAAEGVAWLSQKVREFLEVGDFQLPELHDAEDLRAYAEEIKDYRQELEALNGAKAALENNIEMFGEGSDQAATWQRKVDAAQEAYDLAKAEAEAKRAAFQATVDSVNALGAARDDAQERARLAGITAEAAERERIAKEKTAMIDSILNNAAAADRIISDDEMAAILQIADQWEAAETAASRILNPIKAASNVTREAAAEAMTFATMLDRVNDALGGVGISGNNYAQTLEAVEALYKSGKLSADEYAEALGLVRDKFSETEAAAKQLEGAATSALVSIFNGSKTAKEAVGDLLSQLGNMALQAAFSGAFGGMFNSVAPIFSSAASFDGGGYTGSGPRSGGLDGKGGFMAMVHPQESIIDHTKPAAASAGGSGSVTIQINVSGARGNSEISEMVERGVQRGLTEYDRSVLPRRVGQIQADPRRIG